MTLSRLIDEMRLACSLPALDAAENAAVVRTWGEVLEAAGVPVVQWRRCLIHCLAHRQSTFPVNVSELCEAWRENARAAPLCVQCNGRGQYRENGEYVTCVCPAGQAFGNTG